jgi:hypothetical protein
MIDHAKNIDFEGLNSESTTLARLIWVSGFGLLSAFGLRISGFIGAFGLRTS